MNSEVSSFFVRCMQYCFRVFIGLTLYFLYVYRQCHVVANDGSWTRYGFCTESEEGISGAIAGREEGTTQRNLFTGSRKDFRQSILVIIIGTGEIDIKISDMCGEGAELVFN